MSMATESNQARPRVQIDDLVREMTDAEYAALVASGWTPGDDTPDDAHQAPPVG